MKYEALLLDIDNTLYDYNTTHFKAKKDVLNFFEKFKFNQSIISKAYDKAREKVHMELSGTAASHNRMLYFQKMCEILKLNPLEHSSELYNIYWSNFLANITPFDGVYDVFKKYKNKICFVTDLTADIQFRKIERLNLNEYCRDIVTSEEAGKEKPHPYIFMLALKKLNLKANQVCMIGDNFNKDIIGAANLGINTIWFNHENKYENHLHTSQLEVKIFREILEFI